MIWCVAIFVLIYFLMMKISIEIHFRYLEKIPSLQVYLYFFNGIGKKKFVIPLEKNMNSGVVEYEKSKSKLREIFRQLKEIYPRFKKMCRSIEIQKFNWNSAIGLGEADSTGMITGVLLGVKGVILGILNIYFTFSKDVEMNVTPIYQGKGFYTQFHLKISFRIIRIMILSILIYITLRKMKSINESQLRKDLQFD